jgi:hypothetical protein
MGEVVDTNGTMEEGAILSSSWEANLQQPMGALKEGSGAIRIGMGQSSSPVEESIAAAMSQCGITDSPRENDDELPEAPSRRHAGSMEASEHENRGDSSTLLVRHMQALLANEAKVGFALARSNLAFTTRQVNRLVHRSWPEWAHAWGTILFFKNYGASLALLPTDVLLHLLGYLPQLQVLHLATVCAAFAMPQPALKDAQTLPLAAISASGHQQRSFSRENPSNLWLRAAASTPMERCLVVRERTNFPGWGSSEFSLYVQDGIRGNEMLLLVAKKSANS